GILGVETDDVIVDKGLDFSRGVVSHGHPPVVRITLKALSLYSDCRRLPVRCKLKFVPENP
ncbi:MAG: hypothetical protein WA728_35165, partial [Xanthobacteraceae bacterium]